MVDFEYSAQVSHVSYMRSTFRTRFAHLHMSHVHKHPLRPLLSCTVFIANKHLHLFLNVEQIFALPTTRVSRQKSISYCQSGHSINGLSITVCLLASACSHALGFTHCAQFCRAFTLIFSNEQLNYCPRGPNDYLETKRYLFRFVQTFPVRTIGIFQNLPPLEALNSIFSIASSSKCLDRLEWAFLKTLRHSKCLISTLSITSSRKCLDRLEGAFLKTFRP